VQLLIHGADAIPGVTLYVSFVEPKATVLEYFNRRPLSSRNDVSIDRRFPKAWGIIHEPIQDRFSRTASLILTPKAFWIFCAISPTLVPQ